MAEDQDAEDERRREAIVELDRRAETEPESLANLAFFERLIDTNPSAPVAQAALAASLRCVKTRDGLQGIRPYLQRRLQGVASEDTKHLLAGALTEWEQSLDSLSAGTTAPPEVESFELRAPVVGPSGAREQGLDSIELRASVPPPSVGVAGMPTGGIEAISLTAPSEEPKQDATAPEIEIACPAPVADEAGALNQMAVMSGLRKSLRGQAVKQSLDRAIVDEIMEAAKASGEEMSDDLRRDLTWVVLASPFTDIAYDAFGLLADRAAGRTPREKTASALAWASGHGDPQTDGIFLYYAGYHLYRQMAYDDSLVYADEYLQRRKDYRDRVYLLKALCFANLNRLEEAQASLARIQEEYPDSSVIPQARFLTAWVYLYDQDAAKAKPILEDLVKQYPESPYADKARQVLGGL